MTRFTRFCFIAAVATIFCADFHALGAHTPQLPGQGLKADTFAMKRQGDRFLINLALDYSGLKVSSNRAKVIEPRLVNGNDSITLQPVGIYGHRRYYYYKRNSSDGTMIAGEDEKAYIKSKAPNKMDYNIDIPYAEWMNGATMTVNTCEYGCCNNIEAMQTDTLGIFNFFVFHPQWVFVRPQEQGPKTRQLSGRAFIDFPVDQTVIYPDYRRNATELGKIQATIDSVRNDSDVTITKVWLKGFASPESPYSHNTDLSLGRVAALKSHIQKLYHFAPGVIETDNEPEDWEGLRRFVEESNLEHKAQILELIDSNMAPDPKEARIKKLYPQEYKFMLTQFYPALRHTDYRIDYQIRQFTDINELREIFRKDPTKLSLGEFFTLAASYPEGSEEFNNVFDTAVRMYPTDPTANLNAATAALQSGNYKLAKRFLANAGDSATASYSRGIYAALTEDYAQAREQFVKAANAGMTQAADALSQLDKLDNQSK